MAGRNRERKGGYELFDQTGSTWHVVCVMSLCLLTGCAAAYTPPPLTMQHPAHSEALRRDGIAVPPAAATPAPSTAPQGGHHQH
jgi:hypothetical protein